MKVRTKGTLNAPSGANVYTPPYTPPLGGSWRDAKNTYGEAQMRYWMEQNTGPRVTVSGTAPGGTITTQAQCDAMRGKTVTDEVYLDAASSTTLIIEDVYFLGKVTSDFNTSQVMRYCTVDGNSQTATSSHFYLRGIWTVENVEVRKGQDGVKIGGGANVTLRDVYIHEPSQDLGTLTGDSTHQDGIQQLAGTLDAERVFVDYEYNAGGGQGVIVKADAGTINSFRLVDSFIKAGGNNLTFEPTVAYGSPGSVDLGTNEKRNVFAPAANMSNVLSLYEPNGAMTEPARSTILSSHFYVAEKNGATLIYKNGINKAALEAVQPL